MNKAYLFRLQLWQFDPPEYILVYAKNEEEAREKGAKQLNYNSGAPAEPNHLGLVTYF